MIRLTRLNGKKFVVNADMIKFVDETPDTIVTLANGEKVMVAEKTDEVISRVIEYQRTIRTFPEHRRQG